MPLSWSYVERVGRPAGAGLLALPCSPRGRWSVPPKRAWHSLDRVGQHRHLENLLPNGGRKKPGSDIDPGEELRVVCGRLPAALQERGRQFRDRAERTDVCGEALPLHHRRTSFPDHDFLPRAGRSGVNRAAPTGDPSFVSPQSDKVNKPSARGRPANDRSWRRSTLHSQARVIRPAPSAGARRSGRPRWPPPPGAASARRTGGR